MAMWWKSTHCIEEKSHCNSNGHCTHTNRNLMG